MESRPYGTGADSEGRTEAEFRHKEHARHLADDLRDTDTSARRDGERPRTRPTPDVIEDLSEQINRLVHDEVRLAISETRIKGKRFGRAGALGGVAAVFGLIGALVLVASVIIAITLVLPAWLSALIVGAALVLAALGVAALLRREVSRERPPIPEETIDSLRKDIDAVKRRGET